MEINTTNQNKEFWNTLNSDYAKAWESPAKQYMSDQEQHFIITNLQKTKKRKILDIGVGLGRILGFYAQNAPESELYGVDIAENMLKLTREKFKEYSLLKRLELCDMSKQELPGTELYDFVSCIRVMHYNENWPEFITKVNKRLEQDGIFVFTMANRRSLNIFRPSKMPFFRTTAGELNTILEKENLKVLSIESYTRIPDSLYQISNNAFYSKILIGIEKALEYVFGKIVFGRVLFVAAQKIG